MKVTFDTNALDRAARPEHHPKDDRQPDFIEVHAAIEAGKLEGYFSETIITLEGIENKDRLNTLGGTRLERQFQRANPVTFHINLTVRQDRKPIHPKHSERIQAARKIGLRALRGPARVGWIRIEDPDGMFFESDGSEAQSFERLERTTQAAIAIEARGLGHALVMSLAQHFAARGKASDTLWLQSLRGAKDVHEQRQVQRAIAEWADADSIAAHIGYGIDLFCTYDRGKGAGAPSIFDDKNRAWLEATYHVKFVTLSELAGMI